MFRIKILPALECVLVAAILLSPTQLFQGYTLKKRSGSYSAIFTPGRSTGRGNEIRARHGRYFARSTQACPRSVQTSGEFS
jgi:hypothetical protein